MLRRNFNFTSSCSSSLLCRNNFILITSSSSTIPTCNTQFAFKSSSKKKSSSNNNKKKHQSSQEQQQEEKYQAFLQQQEFARKMQFEQETRDFDLHIKEQEQQLALFREKQLESTFQLVDEDEEQLNNSVMRALVQKQQKKKALAAQRLEQEGIEEGKDMIEEEVDDDEPLFIPSPAPDLLMVQVCDHMQHDQGVKRHALTITFGADGFRLQNMCKEVRRDLRKQLATSYWQMHQTQERSAFFVCTRISHGTADLLITSMTQRVVGYVEKFGYKLNNSYVTLSPDVQHTSVRMLYHYFIFRRTDESKLLEMQMREEMRMEKMEELENELGGDDDDDEDVDGENEGSGKKKQRVDEEDDEDVEQDDGDADFVRGQPEFRNFEPPQVGPQEPTASPKKVSKDQKVVGKIWKDE